MADGIPSTLHPLVPGKSSSNLSDIKESPEENMPPTTSPITTLASPVGSSLTSSIKNDQPEKKTTSKDQESTETSKGSEKQMEESVELKQIQKKKSDESKKTRTRSISAPQKNPTSNESQDPGNQLKTKKISPYQGWSLSTKKDTKTEPKHSSTPKLDAKRNPEGKAKKTTILVDVTKHDEASKSKIPQPKMGIVIKSANGQNYKLKKTIKSDKPVPEEPSLEILERIVVNPKTCTIVNTEVVREPEKPRAKGPSNLPLEHSIGISSKMDKKPSGERKFYKITNPNMSPVVEVSQRDMERALAELKRQNDAEIQARRDQLAEELNFTRKREEEMARNQISHLQNPRKRNREETTPNEGTKKSRYIRPGSKEALELEKTRGSSILDDDTIPQGDVGDGSVVDLTYSDHEEYMTAGDEEEVVTSNRSSNLILDLSELAEEHRPKFIQAAQEVQRILVQDSIPEHDASILTKSTAEVFARTFKTELSTRELGGEDEESRIQHHHDQVMVKLENNHGEVNAALVELHKYATQQINSKVTVDAINNFNAIFARLQEISVERTKEGATLRDLHIALNNGTEGIALAASEANKAALALQNHPASKLVATIDQIRDIKKVSKETQEKVDELKTAHVLFVEKYNEAIEKMERENHRVTATMETDQDIPRNQDANSMQKRYKYLPLSQTEYWVVVPEGHVETVDGTKPRLVAGPAMTKLMRIHDSGRLEEFYAKLNTGGHSGYDGSGGSSGTNIYRSSRHRDERPSTKSKPYDSHKTKPSFAGGYVQYRVDKSNSSRSSTERRHERKPRKTWGEIMNMQYDPSATGDDVEISQRASVEFENRVRGEENRQTKYIEVHGTKIAVTTTEHRLRLRELTDEEIWIKYQSGTPGDFIYKNVATWRDEQRTELLDETYPFTLSLSRH